MMIPVEWLLGVMVALGGAITGLAGIIYKSLSASIDRQNVTITRLQDDIDRLSKGCGIAPCLWKKR